MNVIRITKKTGNQLEQVKLMVSLYCLLSDIKLSDTEITIYSYFIMYKISEKTKNLIFKSGLIQNNNSYKNILSKLKKLELIKKNDRREYLINLPIFNSVDSVVGFILKIDNT